MSQVSGKTSRPLRTLQIVGPLTSAVNYRQYVNKSPANAVRYHPWRTWDHEFASARKPARASRQRMSNQDYGCLLYSLHELIGCARAIGRNIIVSGIDVRARQARPADLHLRRREKVAFISASVANSPASACRKPSRMCSICHR